MGYLEAARKAEFKGNVKKAIDQYQEALFFIRNDDIDDTQQRFEINEIETKLTELRCRVNVLRAAATNQVAPADGQPASRLVRG